MKPAPVLMIQGTASNVGKSALTTGLCRILAGQGLRVAPFKAQNMALNSAVTPTGAEIGRAQWEQALACGVEPDVHMNPVLLKPEGDRRSQVVVQGRVRASMSAVEYHAAKPELRGVVMDSLNRLRRTYDVVVIEGAGSPAEINLRENELVNMFVARQARAPVLLAGDIDRGGVFAAFVGTMALLEPEERSLVAGFIINKFRGDKRLLQPGLDFLLERTGVPVAGVMPWVDDLRLAEEDSLALEGRHAPATDGQPPLKITVLRPPRMSNYDEFATLEHEAGVDLRYVRDPGELAGTHLVILPGSKNTLSDMQWVRERGFSPALEECRARGVPLLGICAGFQMLGAEIRDPLAVESGIGSTPGLGLLPVTTCLARSKVTTSVRVSPRGSGFLGIGPAGGDWQGYEIHMGETRPLDGPAPWIGIHHCNGRPVQQSDGYVSGDGLLAGTLVHGLFENDDFRLQVLNRLRRRAGLPEQEASEVNSREQGFDHLAGVMREHMDMTLIDRLLDRQRSS